VERMGVNLEGEEGKDLSGIGRRDPKKSSQDTKKKEKRSFRRERGSAKNAKKEKVIRGKVGDKSSKENNS